MMLLVSVKRSNYRIHFWFMSKDNFINLVNNSDLSEKGGLLYMFFIIYKNE